MKSLLCSAQVQRDRGSHLLAGLLADQALMCAWGDEEQMARCYALGAENYEKCIQSSERCTHRAVAALDRMAALLRSKASGPGDPTPVLRQAKSYERDLAERLLECPDVHGHADNYVVLGLAIRITNNDATEVWYPEHEVAVGTESFTPYAITVSVPSAFHLFVTLADYRAATAAAERCPDAFRSPGLRGWRAAAEGFVRPDVAVVRFQEAADIFASDVEPDHESLLQRGGHWTSIDIDLWAPYFRARAALARASTDPGNAAELCPVGKHA